MTSETSSDARQPAGELDEETLQSLAAWDPAWTAAYQRMATNPWSEGVLPRKMVELICVGLNAACTTLDAPGTRRHIRAALAAGASRDELLVVLKMASLLAIHSCSLGAPLLMEEMLTSGIKPRERLEPPITPACDAMREIGQWNMAWDPFFDLDPIWTEAFMAAGVEIYEGGVLTAKDVELLSIAFDASVRHMYAPGTARHSKGALAAGATPQEVMEVLKVCVAFGAEALRLGVPILAEELMRGGDAP